MRQIFSMRESQTSDLLVRRSFHRMDASNIYQIKYIIRFLLLWIIFQVIAATEDSCSYQVTPHSVISSNITQGLVTRMNEVSSFEECGKQCCDKPNCSAALYKDTACILVNCELIPEGCISHKVNMSISLIMVSRTAAGQPHSDSSDVPKQLESSTVQSRNDPIGSSGGDNVITTEAPITKILQSISSTTGATGQKEAAASGSADVSSTVTLNATPPGQTVLTVTTGGNQQIRLPIDSVAIHASVTPQQDDNLDYRWKLIEHPKDFEGTQSGFETPSMKLGKLTEGTYQFKVGVSGDNSYGEAFVNVTVLPKVRVNTPPVAVIVPLPQVLTLPTDSTLLDGSKSHDDDGIALYEWEEVEGPLQDNINKDENGNFPHEKVLKITGLVVGNYTFKLTVTDTDGASNYTTTTIVVKKRIDNPPIANAGPNQVIHMPQNSITLCGNDSTDDWGIQEYKWSLSPSREKGGIDLHGAREKCVKVSNLEAGDYEFLLTVKDAAGQEDSAKVTIIVQPESNNPPKADAGEDRQLLLPLDGGAVSANLDGSKSTDDKQITSVLWKMASEVKGVTIVKPSSLQTSVTGITKAGQYTITLTVTDADGDSDSDKVVITVKEEQPPVANAGADIKMSLPDNVAMLNGSGSHDDYGIKEYFWSRTDKSPAAGFALDGSEHKAILHVAELAQGTYTFVLKVTNVRGKTSDDKVLVTVLPDPLTSNLAELHLQADIAKFNEERKQTVVRQLGVLLSLQDEDKVVVRNVFAEHGTGHLVVQFYVTLESGDAMLASEIVYLLNSKLKHDVEFLEFKFIRAETYVCENDCSGHGRCRSGSHECECDVFWMENFFRVYMGDGKRNCDWSVMYTGIVIFILITAISCIIWFLTCYCLRKKGLKKPVPRRRKAKTHDKARYEKIPLKPHRNGYARKNGIRAQAAFKSSSLMRSVSSSTSTLSDSDATKENTLFERKRLLVNGGGKFNGAFDLDANPTKSTLRKNSSFARNGNNSSAKEVNAAFGHQSTVLTVGDSTGEEVL